VTRRQLLMAMLTLTVVSNPAGCSAARKKTSLRIRGADISFTLQEEAAGVTFFAGGQTLAAERILSDRGANYARIRVWVNPEPGTSDLTAALALARRAKAAGMKVLLCLHYSDTWADHAVQTTPASWQGRDLTTLAATVRSYTAGVVRTFAEQDTPVDMVQVGNEVTNGMLWPLGRISRTDKRSWAAFATLVNSAIAGVGDASSPSKAPRVMIHIHPGSDKAACQSFFDGAYSSGLTQFDCIGLSYYPFWQGSLEELSTNLHALSSRYDKDIVIVETSYPWTLERSDSTEMVMHDVSQLPEARAYPPTKQGQVAFFFGLRRVIEGVPNGHGTGFLVWAPEWLPPVGATREVGNAFSNLTMFDRAGRALPALDSAFRERIS